VALRLRTTDRVPAGQKRHFYPLPEKDPLKTGFVEQKESDRLLRPKRKYLAMTARWQAAIG